MKEVRCRRRSDAEQHKCQSYTVEVEPYVAIRAETLTLPKHVFDPKHMITCTNTFTYTDVTCSDEKAGKSGDAKDLLVPESLHSGFKYVRVQADH